MQILFSHRSMQIHICVGFSFLHQGWCVMESKGGSASEGANSLSVKPLKISTSPISPRSPRSPRSPKYPRSPNEYGRHGSRKESPIKGSPSRVSSPVRYERRSNSPRDGRPKKGKTSKLLFLCCILKNEFRDHKI